MIIKNNMSAVRSLNQLRKNDSALAKDLKKLSSGQKINGADDGASEYSIGKRMDVLIRSLDQDIANTKSGRDLVATAEGGIQEVISNLRDMKAMAINAANDHNTDLDRETLEKDFSSRMETITDIAATTNFNGRLLLNGDYRQTRDIYTVQSTPHYAPATLEISPPGYTIEGNRNGTYTYIQDNTVQHLSAGFSEGRNCAAKQRRRLHSGEKADAEFDSANNWQRTFSVVMDFTKANLNGGTLPSALHGQGITLGCAECNQYINIKFDAHATTSTLERGADSDNMEYVIGVQSLTSLSDLPKAIFDGIGSTSYATREQSSANGAYAPKPDSADQVLIDGYHDLHIEKNGDQYEIVKDGPALEIIDRGTVIGVGTDLPNATGKIKIQSITKKVIDGVTYTNIENAEHVTGHPLIIHTGPKANQHLPVFINSMHPIAMGLNGTKIHPREEALQALDTVDSAIEYALDEATRMGAYRTRLSQTEGTLTTNDENTTASMSAIVDADMAALMTQYTKDSVLSQAAQLMLAQANQTSSSVLSLLQ